MHTNVLGANSPFKKDTAGASGVFWPRNIVIAVLKKSFLPQKKFDTGLFWDINGSMKVQTAANPAINLGKGSHEEECAIHIKNYTLVLLHQ
jgi:hypothetical protein